MGACTPAIFLQLRQQEARSLAVQHLRQVLEEFKNYKQTGFPDFEPTTYYTFLDYPDLAQIYWQVASRFPELYNENGETLSQIEVLSA